MDNGKIRAFWAIDTSDFIKNKINEIEEKLKKSKADVKWVNPSSVHLTLKFLGNIEINQIDYMEKTLKDGLKDFPPFQFYVKGTGGFPHLKNPKVVWVGITKGDNELKAMNKIIEDRLYEIGFPREEKKFSPHLTIGRIRSFRNIKTLIQILEDLKEEEVGYVDVAEVILFKSELTPSGSIYTKLRNIAL